MKKSMSVKEAILDFIKKHKDVSTSVLVENLNKPTNQIYTSVWKMLKNGTLVKRNDVLHIAKAPAMTGLAPEITSKQPMATIRKATNMEMHLANKLRKAEEQVRNLQKELNEVSVSYYDALAVIKYLESKTKA